jgi:glucose-1-phosphate cytidylyltransferase
MVPIGERPILWHIMKIYAAQGHKDFVLCLGYKGDIIREYFRNYRWNVCDVTMRLGHSSPITYHNNHSEEDWSITLAETGESSLTATRILRIKQYLNGDDDFLLTYGDGVGNIDVNQAVAEHRAKGRICTITAVHPPGRFGEIDVDGDGAVRTFNEKPQVEAGFINGGFMVCNRRLFDYLSPDEDVMLETGALRDLARDGQLGMYLHNGFWQPMDTFHEFTILNRMWSEGQAPWKIW